MSSLVLAAVVSAVVLAESRAPIVAVAFMPDGRQVLAASQDGVAIHSWPELARTGALDSKLEQVHDLTFSSDGKLLSVAGGTPGESGAVELWQWPLANLSRKIAAGGDVAYAAAWNADASRLAIVGADKRVRIAPATDGETLVCQNDSASVLAAIWLPAENLVITGGIDQALRVIDPQSGKPVRTLDNHTAAVRDLAIRPGRSEGPPLVASAGADRTIRFWQPTIGRLVRFVRLSVNPTALAWRPDGSQILAACEDGRLRGVDPETLASVEFAERLDGWAHAVAASPDGKWAVLAGERGELRKIPLDAIKP
jgi:WD40 repeat protein